MPDKHIILSLMDGLFQGGSPIMHASIVSWLQHHSDQRHDVLSYTSRVQREHSIQDIHASLPHAMLTEAQVGLHWLTRSAEDEYSDMDLLFAEQLMRGSDVLFSLKEQPLALLRRIGGVERPVVVALHRSDPANQGGGVSALRDCLTDGTVRLAVCCAYSVRQAYASAFGLPDDMLPVIPNGVDLTRFTPSSRRRERARSALGIPAQAPVILISARYAGMKNIPLFIRTAALLLENRPDAWFVMCGAGMTEDNGDLQNLLDHHVPEDLHHRFLRIGIRNAMENVYPVADLAVLTSSYGEASPLSLMEAMACGVVPVTTDVGDSALIVGDDRLVGPQEAQPLAEQWDEAIADGDALRHYVLKRREDLDCTACYRRYGEILDSVALGQSRI